MNTKKYKLTAVISLLVGSVSFSNANEMHFDEAWKVLQTKNNSIAAKRANVEKFRQQEKSRESLDLPSVSLGATYTYFDDDITLEGEDLVDSLDSNTAAALTAMGLSEATSTIANQDMLNSSVRIVWPIYTGGRITSAQEIAQGQTDEAVANLGVETLQRYQDLARYYFSVVLAKEVVETRKEVEAGLTKHKDFALKLLQQGQIATVETLQAEASLEQAIVERKSAEKDLEIAVTALTEILNQEVPVSPETRLFINLSLPPLSAFTEQTLSTYPGLDILKAKEKQATNLIKAEKGAYYPEVYLYGNYTLYEDDTLASSITPDWLVGIGVSIPLVETSGRSENVKAAQSSLLQVNYLKAQAVQDLTVLVKRTYYQAEKSIEEVRGLETSLKLAKENLKLRTKAFNQGLSTSLDVVDAELYLASIKTQQLAAKYHYLISLNQLLAFSHQMDTFSIYELNAYQPETNKESL